MLLILNIQLLKLVSFLWPSQKSPLFNTPLLLVGRILGGLKVHPDRQHLVYALGCTVVVEDIQTGKQEFLTGHNNDVTCITISKSGRYIASGQLTHMGFKVSCLQRYITEGSPSMVRGLSYCSLVKA